MKRLFTIVCATMLAGQAWAANYDFKQDQLYYKITSDSTVEITIVTAWENNYPGLTSINIPEVVTNDGKQYSVTQIGAIAFYKCSDLQSITIPNTITSIGHNAFAYCNGLTSITIPESVSSIGESAFKECTNLTIVEFASIECLCGIKYENSGSSLFDANPLLYSHHLYIDGKEVTNLVIPETVTSISSRAFSGCSGITSVVIPNTVNSIGYGAFSDCNNIETLTFNTNAANGICQNMPNLKTLIIGDSVTYIDAEAFKGCNSLTSVSVPNSISMIGKEAFNGCNNLDYNTYDNAYYLGNDVNPYVVLMEVKNKSISSCTVNEGCNIIYDEAFSGCNNLTEIKFPESISNVGYAAFNNCNAIQKAEFASLESLFKIKWVFDYYTVNNPLRYARQLYINGKEETDIIVPEGIESISAFAFASNNLNITSIDIPNSVTSIGYEAFYGCKGIKSITIGYGLNNIELRAFDYCNVETLSINAKDIGTRFSENVKMLQTVILGDSVKIINKDAFNSSTNLKNVISYASVPPTLDGGDPFGYADVVYVRANCVDAYKTAPIWKRKEILPFGIISIKSDNETQGIIEQEDSLIIDGKQLTITAKANNGYHFVKWSDGNTDNPRTYSTAKDTSFTAIFEAHNVVTDEAVAATCTATGLTEGSHCSVCNAVLVAQEVIPALGHTVVVDTAVAATCTATGLTEGSHCSVCNAVLVAQTEIPMAEHIVVVDSAIVATCTESGLSEGKHCSVCDTLLVKQTEIPALGHEFKNYVYNNDATAEADGSETAVCERGCGATDTRVKEGTKLATTVVTESAANAVNIYAHGNTIVVENATDEIRVYDAMGRIVGRDVARNVSTITVNGSGVYIVKTGSVVKRVMVNLEFGK